MALSIINLGYRSTNYWLISAGMTRLLIDIGWPGTMGHMRARLRQMDVPLEEIRYCLATHYHIDHAGLAQEFKQEGVPLLVIDVQVDAIRKMKRWTKPQDNYVEISLDGNVIITCEESRKFLEELGIDGEILHTPGHSDDSVSLLLDDGSAFTGDLTPPMYMGMEDRDMVLSSWTLLKQKGARTIYPAHGPVRLFEDVFTP